MRYWVLNKEKFHPRGVPSDVTYYTKRLEEGKNNIGSYSCVQEGKNFYHTFSSTSITVICTFSMGGFLVH